MYSWFFICVASFLIIVPLHFKSVEYEKLQKAYGKKKGFKIGKIYGTISGTLEFIILIGLWISPQPTFVFPIFSNLTVSIAHYSFPILHLLISLPLTMMGTWFGIEGVRMTGLEAAETHRLPKKILSSGVYSIVRHPQYFGWFISHIGVTFLLSSWYSMLFTPALLLIIYAISKKEEEELLRVYRKEYEDYQKKIPMLIPRFKK